MNILIALAVSLVVLWAASGILWTLALLSNAASWLWQELVS